MNAVCLILIMYNFRVLFYSRSYNVFSILSLLSRSFSGGHFAKYWGGGGGLRYANLSNIILGISNSLFNYCHVTIILYANILVCFLVPLAPKNAKCDIWYHYFYWSKLLGGGGRGSQATALIFSTK